jgi:hypothetical protein
MERSPEAEAELERARRLLEQALEAETVEAALPFLNRVGEIVTARLKQRAAFNRKMDRAFENTVAGPEFPVDEKTGLTVVPDGMAAQPLPSTDDVKTAGSGLIETIERGRKLPGPGPVSGATPWVRIAEDTPYTGPVMVLTKKEIRVEAVRFRVFDLMRRLVEQFGPVIPADYEVVTGAVLNANDQQQMIEMMAKRIAELEVEREEALVLLQHPRLPRGETEH